MERTYQTIDKSSWGAGEWSAEPDKVQWIDAATGLDCLAVRHPTLGHWCGYVGVMEGHPLYQIGYSQCPQNCGEWWCEHRPEALMSVHGGLTYSDTCQEGDESRAVCHVPASGRPDHVWWFGFDCAHSDDYSPGLSAKIGHVRFREEVYRTLEYVKRECADLAGQLATK